MSDRRLTIGSDYIFYFEIKRLVCKSINKNTKIHKATGGWIQNILLTLYVKIRIYTHLI